MWCSVLLLGHWPARCMPFDCEAGRTRTGWVGGVPPGEGRLISYVSRLQWQRMVAGTAAPPRVGAAAPPTAAGAEAPALRRSLTVPGFSAEQMAAAGAAVRGHAAS